MHRNNAELSELLAELTPPVLRAGEVVMAIHERGADARIKADD